MIPTPSRPPTSVRRCWTRSSAKGSPQGYGTSSKPSSGPNGVLPRAPTVSRSRAANRSPTRVCRRSHGPSAPPRSKRGSSCGAPSQISREDDLTAARQAVELADGDDVLHLGDEVLAAELEQVN